jgi:hypothetical protein
MFPPGRSDGPLATKMCSEHFIEPLAGHGSAFSSAPGYLCYRAKKHRRRRHCRPSRRASVAATLSALTTANSARCGSIADVAGSRAIR